MKCGFSDCLFDGETGLAVTAQATHVNIALIADGCTGIWRAANYLTTPIGFYVWRIARPLLTARGGASQPGVIRRVRPGIATRVGSQHAATTIIGVAFGFMLLLVGAWSYTDGLLELARRVASSLVKRGQSLLALLFGAMIGGRTAGRFGSAGVALPQVCKCFLGGALMGSGSILIPGGIDGFLLVRMPLLYSCTRTHGLHLSRWRCQVAGPVT